MSFELLEVPDGFKTNLALVIAPYVDPKFMKKLVQELMPERLCLVVDEGVRREDLEKIKNACLLHGTTLEIRLGRARALVHMKAFYFEYLREDPPRNRRRRLLFGSANATDAGFSGKRNAELIADVNLTIRDDSELAEYFEAILAAFDSKSAVVKIDDVEITLSKQPTLLLPSFSCVVPGKLPTGFDTWLQRAVLAAQYRNTPQFLTVSVPLKKSLPQDLVAKIFANRQFAEKTNRNIVRFGYLNGASATPVDEEDEAKPQWKSRYAVWTHLGDWISDQCYEERSNVMKSKTSDARRVKVDELKANIQVELWKTRKRTNFLTALGQVWADLAASGVAPEDYLLADAGRLDSTAYEERFDKKLEQDILLANDPEFRARYIDGYEFPDVPRFRQDTAAWESFVRSWCDSVLVEAAKSRTNSLVTKRVTEVLKNDSIVLEELSAEVLVDKLRKLWNKPFVDRKCTVGDWIGKYSEHDHLS
jgi:hypothetical protein